MTAADLPPRSNRRMVLLVVVAVAVLVGGLLVLVLRPGRQVPPGPAVLVAAVGDMVCDPDVPEDAPDGDDEGEDGGENGAACRHRAVSDLILKRRPAAFLALGDNQYDAGSLNDFETSYDPSFGRLLDVTRPVPGNHEYETRDAKGYYAYFGDRAGSPSKGYYSFDLGGWHLVALNSNCDEVPCDKGSDQERWLRADLAANQSRCTLAFWHHPRWSQGSHGDNEEVAPLVRALDDAGAELILSGHDHNYQRFGPRSASGTARDDGLRQFVVGTGGRNLRGAEDGNGTEVVETQSFGALFLSLQSDGYTWEFVSTSGSFTDRGSAACH